MVEKTRGSKKENWRNLEVLELLNDEKEENKGMMKKSQNSELFYVCEKLK